MRREFVCRSVDILFDPVFDRSHDLFIREACRVEAQGVPVDKATRHHLDPERAVEHFESADMRQESLAADQGPVERDARPLFLRLVIHGALPILWQTFRIMGGHTSHVDDVALLGPIWQVAFPAILDTGRSVLPQAAR